MKWWRLFIQILTTFFRLAFLNFLKKTSFKFIIFLAKYCGKPDFIHYSFRCKTIRGCNDVTEYVLLCFYKEGVMCGKGGKECNAGDENSPRSKTGQATTTICGTFSNSFGSQVVLVINSSLDIIIGSTLLTFPLPRFSSECNLRSNPSYI